MKRNNVVDIAKGISIIFIIALHCGFNSVTLTCLPLFYFVSGMFAPPIEKRAFSVGVADKTAKLLYPCFQYLVLFVLIEYFLTRLSFPGIEYEHFFSYLAADKLIFDSLLFQPYHPRLFPHAFTLWFLTALWMSYILWFLFRRWIIDSSKSFHGTLKCFVVLVILFYSSITGPTLYENVVIGSFDRALFGFVFISLGYLYQNCAFPSPTRSARLCHVIYAIFVIFAVCFEYVYCGSIPIDDPKSMTFKGNPFKFFPMELSKIVLIMVISYYVDKLPYLRSVFAYIGRKSLHVLVLHPLGIYFCLTFITKYELELDGGRGLVLLVVSLIFSLLLNYLYVFVGQFWGRLKCQ